MKSKIQFVLLILFQAVAFISLGQTEQEIREEQIDADPKREEIQRYFGYEDLTYRYLTLPYDINQNVNQQGKFVEVGLHLLLLFPLLLLYRLRRLGWLFYLYAVILIAYITICFANSNIITPNGLSNSQDNWTRAQESNNLSDSLLSSIFQKAQSIVPDLSEESNEFTYLILFGSFVLILLPLLFKAQRNLRNVLLITLAGFGFLFTMFSAGILWYGFLIVPLMLLVIGYYYGSGKSEKEKTVFSMYSKVLFTGVLVFSALFSLISRVSNIDLTMRSHPEHYGKTIVNGTVFPYSMGLLDEEGTLNLTSPNLAKAINDMNSNNGLIYMIGTSFSFNIKNNVNRIFQDNLLTTFYWLNQQYEDKTELIDVMKASDMKYIIVDLHTPTLDNTPEKSLTNKFRQVLAVLYQNPKVSLIATDRIVEFQDVNGNTQEIANVFGTKIKNFGSYAVYKIL